MDALDRTVSTEGNKLRFRVTENQKRLLTTSGVGLGGLIAGVGLHALFGGGVTSQDAPEFSENATATGSSEDASDMECAEIDVDLPMATNINDEMDFLEAFATAREEVGAGGFFTWRGDSYNTYYKEEWEEMSEEEQTDYIAQVQDNVDYETLTFEENTPSAQVNVDPDEKLVEEEVIEQSSEDSSEEMISDLEETETSPEVEPAIGVGDLNADGAVDAIVVDDDHDGNVDFMYADMRGDGEIDVIAADIEGGEELDAYIVDEGGDGIDETDPVYSTDELITMDEFVILDNENEEQVAQEEYDESTQSYEDIAQDYDDEDMIDDLETL